MKTDEQKLIDEQIELIDKLRADLKIANNKAIILTTQLNNMNLIEQHKVNNVVKKVLSGEDELKSKLEAMTVRYRELWHINKEMEKELAELRRQLTEALRLIYREINHDDHSL